jgi:hypothetical protein
VFGVEGAGRRLVAGVVPGLPEGEAVGPESGDQARSHDGNTEILLLLEAVTIVVVRHGPISRRFDHGGNWTNRDGPETQTRHGAWCRGHRERQAG